MNYRVSTDPDVLLGLGWESLVASHPDGTVFQSPAMYELFEKARKMDPVVVGIAEEGTDELCGVLLGVIIREMRGPVGYFSSRTVIYGGPLVADGTKDPEEVLDMLLQKLVTEVKHRSVFIQFRNFREMNGEQPVFQRNRFEYRDRLNFLVDTTSEELVRKRMGTDKQRQLRKGLESGARIELPSSEEEMRSFYHILEELYRKKVRKPLPDWSFFKAFYSLSKEGKAGVVLLVKLEEKVIGGILCPVSRGRTIYEWYVCGLDREYKDSYPSVLATWAAIGYALENGLSTFDFMGVGLPERDYGVRLFKARFGGEMVNFGRFARINSRALYAVSELGYNLLALFKKI